MNLIRPTIYLVLVTVLASCAQGPLTGPARDATYRITVMHANDHHGRF
ncbi:MAG: 2',3'-cyclic-nucleotide 2'-phosphodiesterase (5'-nucleotidase family) [Rhodoferax sp.]|jgi:2',3'-cyclic-nucleotide 2'-phosphodiesterase (5'-nucleotidase family)